MTTGTDGSLESDRGNANRQSLPDDLAELKQLARRLAAHCRAYRGADLKRGITQLVTTAVLFGGLAAAMLVAVAYEYYWVSALLTLPTGAFLVRLFIIQHDCGHGSFFRSRAANDMLGRAISLVTLTPYSVWRQAHAVHHATSGNLDRRGVGDINTLTVAEYRALPRFRRAAYRLYRHPVVQLVIGAPYQFILRQRLPFGRSFLARRAWRSILSLNLAAVGLYGGAVLLLGYESLLIVYLPIVVIAAWIGGWMFFIQHQFEKTFWRSGKDYDFQVAALLGSSYYVLPGFLNWLTGNIGLHHIHHLCGKIPNYRLQECLKASPELQNINRLTFFQSLKSVSLTLWDEDQRKMVGFRSLKAVVPA